MCSAASVGPALRKAGQREEEIECFILLKILPFWLDFKTFAHSVARATVQLLLTTFSMGTHCINEKFLSNF